MSVGIFKEGCGEPFLGFRIINYQEHGMSWNSHMNSFGKLITKKLQSICEDCLIFHIVLWGFSNWISNHRDLGRRTTCVWFVVWSGLWYHEVGFCENRRGKSEKQKHSNWKLTIFQKRHGFIRRTALQMSIHQPSFFSSCMESPLPWTDTPSPLEDRYGSPHWQRDWSPVSHHFPRKQLEASQPVHRGCPKLVSVGMCKELGARAVQKTYILEGEL